MSYFAFVSLYRRLLAFGFLTALSSSFGQTFFISLFLPYFLRDFVLNEGDFGFLYAGSTLLGALCLPYLGCRIDKLDLRRYTTLTILGMASAAWLVAFAPHVLVLAIGILGLRLTGQGLLGHISQTVMAREFLSNRGKALGVAGLGYPLGEGLLPLACAVALRFVPWTAVWVVVGALVLAVVLPVALYLLRESAAPTESSLAGATEGWSVQSKDPRSPLRDSRLYRAFPAILLPSFLMTGMFLYQMSLSNSRGWAPEWMAAAFSGFAVSRALSSLLAGPLIDRFSAKRLLPIYLLPLGAGLVLLRFGEPAWIAFPYLILAGMTAGAAGSIASAICAELFGVADVGRVRSMTASLGVISAAASPALMGALFHAGLNLEDMLPWGVALILAASLIAVSFAGAAEAGDAASIANPGRGFRSWIGQWAFARTAGRRE